MRSEAQPVDTSALIGEIATLVSTAPSREAFVEAALEVLRRRLALRRAVVVISGAPSSGEPQAERAASLEVPIVAAGERIGWLALERDASEPFGTSETAGLEGVAALLGMAAGGAELARRLEAAHSALEAERFLGAVSRELTSILDLDPLLDRIAAITREFVDYELFAILLVDAERQEFVWKTSVGYSEESHRELERFGLGEGVIGRVVATGAPVVVADVAAEPEYRAARTASGRLPASELALPLVAKERVIGVLVLESTEKAYFRPHHVRLLEPLAAQVAIALENARLYERAHQDALTNQVMNEIGHQMTQMLELDELLNRFAILMRRVIAYEILGIFLYRPEIDRLELKVAIGYDQGTIERIRSLRPGEGIIGHAARDRATIVSPDLEHDPRSIPARTIDGRATLSEAAVPIIFRDRLLGAVMVESCDTRFFTTERVQLLETLASQMAVSINNAALFQEVLQKEQKLEANFELARDLQSSMLPIAMPELPGFDVAAVYKPAESLGGDYYDFIWLDKRLLGFAIGDVSGKGVAAAMTMAATRSALRFASRINTSPSQVLYHTNRRLFRDVKNRTFVSLFYGILDLEARVCRWSNAGHYPPLLVHADGSSEELDRGGMVLALFDKARYSSQQTTLRPGDVLVCYTDGVIEARNMAEEEFEKTRLEEIVKRKRGSTARELVRLVTGELRKFTRGAPQHDDITLVILKVDPSAIPRDALT